MPSTCMQKTRISFPSGQTGTVTAQNRGATTLHASFASFAALPSDALYYYLEALTANSLYENDFSYADMSAFQGKNPGNLTVSDGILTVGNGVAAYYNGEGAKEWKNYKYSGKIKFGDLGPDVILRAQDEKNHMMVSFGIKSLIIYTCIGGTYESKADIPYSCLAADGFDEFEIYAMVTPTLSMSTVRLLWCMRMIPIKPARWALEPPARPPIPPTHQGADSGRESGQRNCRRGKTGDCRCR